MLLDQIRGPSDGHPRQSFLSLPWVNQSLGNPQTSVFEDTSPDRRNVAWVAGVDACRPEACPFTKELGSCSVDSRDMIWTRELIASWKVGPNATVQEALASRLSSTLKPPTLDVFGGRTILPRREIRWTSVLRQPIDR